MVYGLLFTKTKKEDCVILLIMRNITVKTRDLNDSHFYLSSHAIKEIECGPNLFL